MKRQYFLKNTKGFVGVTCSDSQFCSATISKFHLIHNKVRFHDVNSYGGIGVWTVEVDVFKKSGTRIWSFLWSLWLISLCSEVQMQMKRADGKIVTIFGFCLRSAFGFIVVAEKWKYAEHNEMTQKASKQTKKSSNNSHRLDNIIISFLFSVHFIHLYLFCVFLSRSDLVLCVHTWIHFKRLTIVLSFGCLNSAQHHKIVKEENKTHQNMFVCRRETTDQMKEIKYNSKLLCLFFWFHRVRSSRTADIWCKCTLRTHFTKHTHRRFTFLFETISNTQKCLSNWWTDAEDRPSSFLELDKKIKQE